MPFLRHMWRGSIQTLRQADFAQGLLVCGFPKLNTHFPDLSRKVEETRPSLSLGSLPASILGRMVSTSRPTRGAGAASEMSRWEVSKSELCLRGPEAHLDSGADFGRNQD